QIHDLGFKVIRINLVCNPLDPNDIDNQMTDMFFAAASYYGVSVALVIQNYESADTINYYLNRWGGNLTYIQIMNEPETSSGWDVGALFTDDEIISDFNSIYATVVSHH